MAQASDLIVTVGVDSAQGQAALAKLQQQLGATAAVAEKHGKSIDSLSDILRQSAEAERKASAVSLTQLRARVDQSAKVRASIHGVGLEEKQQVAILKQLDAQAKTDAASLKSMFVGGQLSAERYVAELKRVEAEQQKVQASIPTPAPGGGKTLGGAFTAGLGGLTGDLARASGEGVKFRDVLMGAAGGAAAGAVTAGLSAIASGIRAVGHEMVDSVHQFAEADEANRKLASSLALVGQSLSTPSLQAFAESMSGATVHTDEAIKRVIQFGASMDIPISKLPRFSAAAADLASALHVDLDTAAKQLAQTLDGDIGRLGQMVPALAGMSKAELEAGGAIDLVAAKFRGMAVDDAQTLKGALGDVTKQFGELKEAFGQGVTASGAFEESVRGLADTLRGLKPAAESAGESISALFSDGKTGKFLSLLMGTGAAGSAGQGLARLLGSARESGEAARTAEEALASRGGGELGGLKARQSEAADQAERVARIEREAKLKEKIHGINEKLTADAKDLADAEQKARDDAEAKSKALKDSITAIEDRAFATRHVIDETGKLTSDVNAQADIYAKLKQQAEGDIGTINALWISGQIGIKQATEEIAMVTSALDEAKAAADGLGLALLMKRRGKDIAGGADELQTRDVSTIADTSAQDMAHEVATAAARQESDALAALVVQMGDVKLAREQQAIAQAEAALQYDLERIGVDNLTSSQSGEIESRQRLIGKMKEQLQQDKAMAQQAALTKSARVQQNAADISGALSSVAAVTKSAKAKIAIQAAQNVLSGLTETAKSAASFAEHDYVAGVAHAVSAASFVYAASQAGHGGGGGGSGGGGGESAPRDQPGADTYRAMRESEPTPRGPTYQIAITGTLLGGHPQDIARQVQSYLSQYATESAGRSMPVRG